MLRTVCKRAAKREKSKKILDFERSEECIDKLRVEKQIDTVQCNTKNTKNPRYSNCTIVHAITLEDASPACIVTVLQTKNRYTWTKCTGAQWQSFQKIDHELTIYGLSYVYHLIDLVKRPEQMLPPETWCKILECADSSMNLKPDYSEWSELMLQLFVLLFIYFLVYGFTPMVLVLMALQDK
ncbi:hypothetical protein AGLY_016306 [Aphis glycines]|uniref:Uncharacterized protein n=1 Tax=Aphis glycines TaxID=307491 RepID=A0A6G0SYX8_APHGL|nr:hypothetical protein AGLY_016306 [Aphis glycines]